MTSRELLNKIDGIIENSKTAILVTSDEAGGAHGRWMTPALLKHRPAAIYCFSAPHARKVGQIEATGKVEWIIQTKDLREIVNVRGTARVLDNPALKNELMEILGPRLMVFWKANIDAEEFVVIETAIEEATYMTPMKGRREIVKFS
jgi:general stress protein 26